MKRLINKTGTCEVAELACLVRKTEWFVFFSRAAQKLNLSSSPHRRKRHSSGDEEYPVGGFSSVIQRTPPPVPPALLRRIGVKEITGVGKVSADLPGSLIDFLELIKRDCIKFKQFSNVD